MQNNYSLHIVDSNSKSFKCFIKELYIPFENKYSNQPQNQHLLNCYVLKQNKKVVGRFAMYHNPKIKIDAKKTLIVGSYECVKDSRVSDELIQHIKTIAKQQKAVKLIGPMEGSTWHNYRFSIQNTPLFFTEVKHKPYYANQFIKNGFKVLKTYSSTIDKTIKIDKNRLIEFKAKFASLNLNIRHININNFEKELSKIGEFCNETFAKNYLFSPLPISDFVTKYISIKPFVVSDLFYIVEDDKKNIQAFLFCIPNYLDSSKQSIIVKSMASLPKRELAGLQIYLGELMYAKALKLGFTKAIHAYMIDDNMSKGLSKKFNADVYQTHHLYVLDL